MSILGKKYLSLLAGHNSVTGISFTEGDVLSARYFEIGFKTDQSGLHVLSGDVNHLQGTFDFVSCRICNADFTLIPQPVFDPAQLHEYLKIITPSTGAGKLFYDRLVRIDSVNVYAVNYALYNFLVKLHPSIIIRHNVSACVEFFMRKSVPGYSANVEIAGDYFYLLIKQNDKLLCCNRYRYGAPEDILYYLLFTLEQFSIDKDLLVVYLSGSVSKNAATVILLGEYFNEVSTVETDNFNLQFRQLSPELRNEAILLNQQTCVL